ncbi:HEPN domain-containing protein [Paenibacillus sp. FSL H8-0259]|uniref:HEPN domain-containing protein n=1 Tax=Paenibacillus sp. FSL H8-0259 TaxID=1920423 RepID=UPI00096C0F9A|nr:HEPN domain-containing protein [Paenibacillus sp. FSL H8-0259]OMF30987.1 hypothetical protein BK132_06035 [Paenibacillus sp. FSL H8-0259]
MEFLFVARIINLTVSTPITKLDIFDELKFSNNKDILDKIIRYKDVTQDIIGLLEYNSLYEGTFAYATGDSEKVKHNFNKYETKMDKLLFLDHYMKLIQHFTNSLWLVKDNCVNTELGYLCLYDAGVEITSNSRVTYFSKTDGNRENTHFTRQEINKALSASNELYDVEANRTMTAAETQIKVSSNSYRVERFFYFLQSARSEVHLPSRIALYCTMIESIFSTSRNEMTHKISERIAVLLGTDGEDRMRIYNVVKDAYSIRSSAVHGDLVSSRLKNYQKQKEICMRLDELLRNLAWLIIQDKTFQDVLTLKNDELEEYFIKMILKF